MWEDGADDAGDDDAGAGVAHAEGVCAEEDEGLEDCRVGKDEEAHGVVGGRQGTRFGGLGC